MDREARAGRRRPRCVFPFTSTGEQARQAVAACRYPPHGLRGSGAGLATATWPEPDRYLDSADEQVMVVTIIEDAAAVSRIDEIAATPGLDVVFIGTSDLSFSMGYRGRQDVAEVQAAIDRVREAAARHGKVVGRPAGTTSQIQSGLEQGFRFFQLNSDLSLLELGAKSVLEPLGRGPVAGPRALY